MTDVKFQKELFKDVYEEAIPLVQKHYDEIAHYKDIPLDPDIEVYKKMEDAGIVRVFTARKAEKLIGYAVFIVKYNPHYKASLQAIQDVIFIDPQSRGVGKKFIQWADEQLFTNDNVQVVYHHVKTAHNFGTMLERMGYTLIDLIYGRRAL